MKVLIATGGTGGHFYPALSFQQELKNRDSEVFFIVKLNNSVQNLLEKENIKFQEISCAPFFGQSLLSILNGIIKNLKGVKESFQILKTFSPDCVVGFGSYVSVPVALAAFLSRTPVFLHEQNLVPGWANRFCALFSKKVAVSFPESALYFRKKAVLTGNFVRTELFHKYPLQTRRRMGLFEDRFTLLVFGGSSGAKQLNQWILNSLEQLKELRNTVQFIHISGNSEESKKLKNKYETCQFKSVVLDYAYHMEDCYASADLSVCRAGATTIAELIATKTPAILIPYPYAVGKHQEKNANYLTKMGSSLVVSEGENFEQNLSLKVKEMVSDSSRLKKMKDSYREFHVDLSRSTEQFADIIEKELFQSPNHPITQ